MSSGTPRLRERILSASPFLRYGLAVVAALAALLLQCLLTPVLRVPSPYLMLYPAMMVVATTLGAIPALITTGVGLVLAEIWLVPPIGHFTPATSSVVRFIILLLTSLYVGRVGERLRAARTEAETEAKTLRKTEEALRVSERKFSIIYDRAPYAISLATLPDAVIVDVNKAWLGLFGFAKEGVLGKTDVELGIMRDPEARFRMLEELQKRGSVRGVEIAAFTRSGERLTVSNNADLIEFEDRKYLLATLEDITERKRAAEWLRQTTEELQKVMSSVSDYLWSAEVDSHGGLTYRYYSPAVEKVTGRPPEFYMEHPEQWLSTIFPEDRQRLIQASQRISTGQSAHEEEEYRIVLPDGTIRWVRDSATGTRLGQDRLRIDGVVSDITERKRAEEHLKEAKELGDALNRINAIIHSTLDFDAIMHQVIVETATALNVDASSIGLFEGDYFVMKYVYNMPKEAVGHRIVSREMKGIHYAASIKDVVVFNDAFHNKRLNVEMMIAYGIRSLMIAPFIARETVLGAMSFYCFVSPHYFSDMHIDFARKLSASISLALENARLFAEVKAAQERASFFANALESSRQPFASGSPDGRLMRFNQAFADLTGYSTDELHTMTWTEITPPEWRAYEEKMLEELHRTGQPQTYQKEYIRKDGSRIPIELKVHQAADEKGHVLYYYAFFTDITEHKRLEEQMKHLAHHDALTGLPNRRLLMDILTIELAKARRSREKFAVLFLDLDRFKYINDTLGHDIGDELLRKVAERIRHSIRGSDTVARLGGDEFNIILTDISHADDIMTIAKKIIDSFREPYIVRGHGLYITTSIGISIYPDDAENVEGLFKSADLAMYHAKESGGNTYQFYDSAMNIRTIERVRLESWLREVIHQGELEVYYQPQIAVDTRQVVCAEALVRWRHAEQGLLDPKHFISLAEETGLITSIDEWVLRTACTQLKEWQEAGLLSFCVTVNLSAKQFLRTDLVERIALILKETGLESKFLDIEITESTAMKNLEHTVPMINRLVDIGVGISIDDFGTGYSSLSYLKKLPIQKLKIDQSFIRDIATDPDDRAIISAVTAMAQEMKLKVIAEGVETVEQIEFLISIGCHEVQGYLFSKPLPAEEFKELILNGRKR